MLFATSGKICCDGVQVELASWSGPDFVRSMLLDKMPEMMRKDTEKLVEASTSEKRAPQRLTRKEAARRASAQAAGSAPSSASAGMWAAPAAGPTEAEDADMVRSSDLL